MENIIELKKFKNKVISGEISIEDNELVLDIEDTNEKDKIDALLYLIDPMKSGLHVYDKSGRKEIIEVNLDDPVAYLAGISWELNRYGYTTEVKGINLTKCYDALKKTIEEHASKIVEKLDDYYTI